MIAALPLAATAVPPPTQIAPPEATTVVQPTTVVLGVRTRVDFEAVAAVIATVMVVPDVLFTSLMKVQPSKMKYPLRVVAVVVTNVLAATLV